MESNTVPQTGLSLEDLRVEELEPRLEFAQIVCVGSNPCEACYVLGEGDGDFAPVIDAFWCNN